MGIHRKSHQNEITMHILLLGSGGREHTLAWKLAQSPQLTKLFIAPGNAGTAALGTNLPLSVNDFQAIKKACMVHHIDMVVVGPEDPLVNGIHDYFLEDATLRHIHVIGPRKAAARLEGSKDFAKDFMNRYNIPTAKFQTFTRDSLNEGITFLEKLDPPYVLKADGLASGKGVVICATISDAVKELKSMLEEEKFGKASSRVVIEEFLKGIECSVFILTDGDHYCMLPEAKDYKKIGEGDTGPNTGGMGSISPVPFAQGDFLAKVEQQVIQPTLKGLQQEGIRYEGFIFFGLMNVDGDPFVIEYNCRLGDPETESILPRIKNDQVPLFQKVAHHSLRNEILELDPRTAASVMLVSEGYPGSYEKGKVITMPQDQGDCLIFQAGTREETGDLLTNGGRVIAVTGLGNTLQDALDTSYRMAEQIHFDGKYFRKDLGFDLSQPQL